MSLEDIAADYDGIYDYVCTKLPEENDPDMFFEGYEAGILQLNKPIMRYRPNKACFFNVKFFVLYYSILWYFL